MYTNPTLAEYMIREKQAELLKTAEMSRMATLYRRKNPGPAKRNINRALVALADILIGVGGAMKRRLAL